MVKLQEYVDLVLPRAAVDLAAERLRAFLRDPSPTRTPGSAAWLLGELERALDRDRARVATAKVQTAIGELEVEDLLAVTARVLEIEKAGELRAGDRREALMDAFERARAEHAGDAETMQEQP